MTIEFRKPGVAKPKARQRTSSPASTDQSDKGLRGFVPFWMKLFLTVLGILLFKYTFKAEAEWQSNFLTNLTTEIIAISAGLWFLNKIEDKDNQAIREMEENLTSEFQKITQQLTCQICQQVRQATLANPVEITPLREDATQPTPPFIFDDGDDLR